MGYTISPIGLLVHTHEDWPCAICRPGDLSESRGHCLCLDCARNLMRVAGAGLDDARFLVPDIAQAMAVLLPEPEEVRLAPD